MVYADYYERALTNGVLGIQRGTDPGVMIYMLLLASGSTKDWGTPFDSLWCCYGTGLVSIAHFFSVLSMFLNLISCFLNFV